MFSVSLSGSLGAYEPLWDVEVQLHPVLRTGIHPLVQACHVGFTFG